MPTSLTSPWGKKGDPNKQGGFLFGGPPQTNANTKTRPSREARIRAPTFLQPLPPCGASAQSFGLLEHTHPRPCGHEMTGSAPRRVSDSFSGWSILVGEPSSRKRGKKGTILGDLAIDRDPPGRILFGGTRRPLRAVFSR